MSVVWTKEMADAFLMESTPDSMFPCETNELARSVMLGFAHDSHRPPKAHWQVLCSNQLIMLCDAVMLHSEEVLSDEKSAYDAYGRCKLQCANCNYRMLFNELKCVKADLETTNETLEVTASRNNSELEELHSMKRALEERKKSGKFSSAIAKMVRSEMSDVRTQ